MRGLMLAAALVLAGTAEAGAYQMIGPGLSSCGTWLADRRSYDGTTGSAAALQDMAWVLGFLSGIGFVGLKGADPMAGVDADGVWASIDAICKAHPIENIETAAARFYFAHPHK